jgi:thiol-disulfide isomerase/thioredoxin
MTHKANFNVHCLLKPAFLLLVLIAHPDARAQHQRSVEDNGIRFQVSDSSGLTTSYIAIFGDSVAIPSLVTIEGRTFTPLEMKGKTIVYNFWFTACKPCVAEIPALNMLGKKYASDTLIFIAITFDEKNKIDLFLKKTPFDFQIVHMPMADLGAIPSRLRTANVSLADRQPRQQNGISLTIKAVIHLA